jgi:hypothetical protein
MKRVSKAAWDYFSKYSEGIELSSSGVRFPCAECCLEICKSYQETDDRARIKKEKIDAINRENPEQGYWISKEWFQGTREIHYCLIRKEWKKKNDVSNSVDAHICCPHQRRIPDDSKCILVSKEIYDWLLDSEFAGQAITGNKQTYWPR